MNTLLMEELDPYIRGKLDFEITGPNFVLTPKSALALSLAIHELATNAAKYGALSRSGGSVAIRWHLTEQGSIELSWTESGGPEVKTPNRRGFGSTLIERALAMETDGVAKIRYLPGGVVCDVTLPPASMAPTEGSPMLVPAVPANSVTEPDPKVGEGIRILVVEDSFMTVGALELVFQDLGWTMVGPVTRLQKALAQIACENFDAVLIDVNLDGEMSWEVAAALKQRSIPFVFSTGYEIETILPDFLAGSRFIRKPYKINELESSILSAIKLGKSSPR